MKCPNPQCGRPNHEGRKFCIYCGASLPSEPQAPEAQSPQTGRLEAGTLLQGRYQITRQLNSGGMGTVYLARDNRLGGKVVAIKEGLDRSDKAQEQFELQATLLANLYHPNLPQVSDRFIEPGGRQYLVMEYVDGDDLAVLLARNRGHFAEAQVLPWTDQLLDALDYLHTQNPPVIHRDIKLDNVKITPQGTLKLVDFGISKVLHSDKETQVGAQGWYTAGFSPLEQQVGGTDARSDLYALGATLYCLLTGLEPPEANDLAAGRVQLEPCVLNPAMSKRTEKVILKAMQPRPEDRYQTAAHMRRDLIPRPRSKWPLYFLIGSALIAVLSLLVLFLGPVLLRALQSDTHVAKPTATPRPSASFTPTATRQATRTPLPAYPKVEVTPTATRMKVGVATATRAATRTPRPTNTPVSGPTSTRAAIFTPTTTNTPQPTATATPTMTMTAPTQSPGREPSPPQPEPTRSGRDG